MRKLKDFYYEIKHILSNVRFLKRLHDCHHDFDMVDSMFVFAENCVVRLHESDNRIKIVDWHGLLADLDPDRPESNKWLLDERKERSQFRTDLAYWYVYCTYWRDFYLKYQDKLDLRQFETVKLENGNYKLSDDHFTDFDRKQRDISRYISDRIEQLDQEMIEFVAKNRHYFWI